MAASSKDVPSSFEEMIHADRTRRKAEALANRMLGSGRRQNAPAGPFNRKNTPGGALASRMGVTKQRSSSATPKADIDTQWAHDLHPTGQTRNARALNGNGLARTARNNRILKGLQDTSNGDVLASAQANLLGSARPSMNIRGMAQSGPFVVIASNFAPGTTAADIQAAMEPIGGEVTSCRLVSANPTVIAELIFQDRAGADNVIATFNNQRADGRQLYVYMKQGGPSPIHNPQPAANDPPPPNPTRRPQEPSREPAATAPASPRQAADDQERMDVDDESRAFRPREPERVYNRDRHTDSGYHDGRYGFSDPYERRPHDRRLQGGGRYDRGYNRGLYSDRMYPRGQSYRPPFS